MANNYNQATVSPDLPVSHFTPAELEALATSCGLRSEPDGDYLYFFAEESFCEEGEDENGEHLDCIELFQAKLRQLDPVSHPHITIEGAATCSKMRPGEFGGFAYFITRDEMRYFSTWQWLNQQGTKADAQQRVMHAGPKLLEACQNAFMQFEHNGDECTEDKKVLDQLQTVIAEATGRTA